MMKGLNLSFVFFFSVGIPLGVFSCADRAKRALTPLGEAAQEFERLSANIAENPDDRDSIRRRALLMVQHNWRLLDLEEKTFLLVEEELERVLAHNPNDGEVQALVGKLKLSGDWDRYTFDGHSPDPSPGELESKALPHLNKAIEVNSTDMDSRFRRALAHQGLGQAKGSGLIEQSSSIASLTGGHNNSREHFQRALADAQELGHSGALAHRRYDSEFYELLAEVQMQLGRDFDAMETFSLALERAGFDLGITGQPTLHVYGLWRRMLEENLIRAFEFP